MSEIFPDELPDPAPCPSCKRNAFIVCGGSAEALPIRVWICSGCAELWVRPESELRAMTDEESATCEALMKEWRDIQTLRNVVKQELMIANSRWN